MKLVIDIPKWKYKSICEGVEASKRCGVVGIAPDIHEAIYNGTPLPKGHGDLIDKKVAYRKFYARCLAPEAMEVFAETPTVIPADK